MFKTKLLIDLLTAFSLTGLLGLVWWQLQIHEAQWLPIRHVSVEGNFRYLTQEQIKQALHDPLQQGFLQINLQQLDQTLQALPWVEQVMVKRTWPDAIKVMIEEQQAVARWNDEQLLNEKGESFTPDKIDDFAKLPLIVGPQGQQQKLWGTYKALKLALQAQNLVLQDFIVNDRRAWILRLDNGVAIKVGRGNQWIKVERFLKTAKLLGNELLVNALTVDLRYPNGYAVNWKTSMDKINKELVVAANHARDCCNTMNNVFADH